MTELTLLQKQKLFAKLLGIFLTWIYSRGYEVTLGELERSKKQAEENAKKGIGIKNSLHLIRLAIDVFLFKNGVLQVRSEDYAELGAYWKSLHPLCCWGGDFSNLKDGGHFSITHNGIK